MDSLQVFTMNGGLEMLTSKVIEGLTGKLHGHLLLCQDQGYELARRVWNGMVDHRPALIAQCVSDVVACVNFAREHQLLISVRGGGHNYAGKAVCHGGLVIDLSLMKGIQVKPEQQTVRAQAGLRLGGFDRETQKFGLATTLGVNTDTGIAGLTLGGGYGWLAGKYGLACEQPALSGSLSRQTGPLFIAVPIGMRTSFADCAEQLQISELSLHLNISCIL